MSSLAVGCNSATCETWTTDESHLRSLRLTACQEASEELESFLCPVTALDCGFYP